MLVKERRDLRADFASRVGSAHSIIVAFTGLVHDQTVSFCA